MNFEVHFSSAAQDDIDQIFDYISIALCSPIAAKNLMGKIQESSLYCVSFTTDKKQSNLQYYRNLTTESISPRISSRALVKLNELCQ